MIFLNQFNGIYVPFVIWNIVDSTNVVNDLLTPVKEPKSTPASPKVNTPATEDMTAIRAAVPTERSKPLFWVVKQI